MSFNSYSYAIFLPIVFLVYWAIPAKQRWLFMLVASYYFYMCWNPKYVLLIAVTTLVSYFSAIMLEICIDNQLRKVIVGVAAVICLGILFLFKYYKFFAESVAALLGVFSVQLSPALTDLILPVGISFYTFQTISYVVDVYRKDIPAERHLGYYAAYVSFFPQLVAGPIERARDLLPQIKEAKILDYDFATYGLKLMAWGYFKKIVIADTLAVFAKEVFNDPYNYHGLSLIIATLCFSIEIYCDFSGYSDIAIGTARLFGIRLKDNFKSPYFSKSIREFWRRWHISLSTWMRDYVYIPLGGNKVGPIRYRSNLFITFLVSGLWHGADWTYVIWGGIHGIAQVIESLFPSRGNRKMFDAMIGVLITYFICVVALVFFAANTVGDAIYILLHFFEGISSPLVYIKEGMRTNLSWESIRCLVISLGILGVFDYVSLKRDVITSISDLSIIKRWSIYIAFMTWLIMNVSLVDNSQFIYFQF